VSPLRGVDAVFKVVDLIPTIQEHHPRLCAVRLFGIENSEQLADGLAGLGFYPIPGTSWDGIGFARRLGQIENVPVIRLNAAAWKSQSDLYDAFFEAVGAPDWHGRNFNALNDSVGSGGINRMEVPYRIVIGNAKGMSNDAEVLFKELDELIRHLQLNGCPVDLEVEQS
jgi:RNAse (barnase) inhibitor barstar